MANVDLAMKFHMETGMEAKNHYKEYFEWLEGNVVEKFKNEEAVKELFNEE